MKTSRLFFATAISAQLAVAADSAKPNIIFIMACDLGYGDMHCLNPQRGKIPTPNLDRRAAQGMAFTDAHGSSPVCTPSRYSILTGRYNWRSWLQSHALKPYGPEVVQRLTAKLQQIIARTVAPPLGPK